MGESGFSKDKVWSIDDWEAHINSKGGMIRYDRGQYGYRNDRMIDLLAKHIPKKTYLKIFEFAGAGGFLAKRILENFKVSKYLHTDYSYTPVEFARKTLKWYPHVKIQKLDAIKDIDKIDLSVFNLVTSTSTGYIFNNIELFKKLKPGTYVLISFPYGWITPHMIRFPSEYAIMKYYENVIDFIEIQHTAFLPESWKTKFVYWLSTRSGLNFHKNIVSEKFVCLGVIPCQK